MTKHSSFALILCFLLIGGSSNTSYATDKYSYLPPGDLVPGSGIGRVDQYIYAPDIRFPIELLPAYANSQVYGTGGLHGPSGSQCDNVNYSYPWRDTYCENRPHEMQMCPSGTGHQGQDIRPPSCVDDNYWVLSSTDGNVTHIGSFSVYITADDGTRFDYLHMKSVAVTLYQRVAKGEKIGKVSDNYGKNITTIHLHYNILKALDAYGDTKVFVPPYASLVQSYKLLLITQPNNLHVQ